MTQPCNLSWMHVMADLRAAARSRCRCEQLCFFADTYCLPICATSHTQGRHSGHHIHQRKALAPRHWSVGRIVRASYGQPCL